MSITDFDIAPSSCPVDLKLMKAFSLIQGHLDVSPVSNVGPATDTSLIFENTCAKDALRVSCVPIALTILDGLLLLKPISVAMLSLKSYESARLVLT